MKKRSLWFSAAGALVVAIVLAGCGTTTYFAGRVLPPSGMTNRVLIAVQNPSASSAGALSIRGRFLRHSLQLQPEDSGIHHLRVFRRAARQRSRTCPKSRSGGLWLRRWVLYIPSITPKKIAGAQKGLNGPSSSMFITRNRNYIFAASQTAHVLTVVDKTNGGQLRAGPARRVPCQRQSGRFCGSRVCAEFQFVYYMRKLTAAETIAYSGGPSTWPKAAMDCEPQSAQAGACSRPKVPIAWIDRNPYGAPLVFDRPVKAVFSADGSTAYVLNCGPECGGSSASVRRFRWRR